MRAQREDDHRFASVCQTAEIVLGRPLTDSQTRTLMNAYEYLGLPADVLIDRFTYLHRSKGTVSRRDIDEQAHLWADMGIFSADAAAAFLAQREREKPLDGRNASRLGHGRPRPRTGRVPLFIAVYPAGL